ncbi:hypothetical protein KUC_1463 [Vreelandella boliviensis LC1]|uniref:Uncharacterized protein n=1 Tax=Vreelandella boliviensis LC1 TaxID=1072583 RepID=A0A7U9C3V8_9GAMM|nr:hypothetical protein KUC_1463 [Halomonas boliviensis LC1]
MVRQGLLMLTESHAPSSYDTQQCAAPNHQNAARFSVG